MKMAVLAVKNGGIGQKDSIKPLIKRQKWRQKWVVLAKMPKVMPKTGSFGKNAKVEMCSKCSYERRLA
ncbi:MAG: hypothetical protein IJ121_05675 [Eubacterium sp.]|nr:hypothetical protein [Eubacterium sp.]